MTPRCDKCDECYTARSKKHSGVTEYCRLNGRDVVQSYFGHNSPRVCPKRKQQEDCSNESTSAQSDD